MLGLAESSDGLDPTEDLLDSLAFFLTDGVARVLRGPLIDGAAASFVLVLGHVRSHRRFPEFVHKISRVVVLVSAQRHPPRAAISSAASRSAVPVACVSRVSTTSPLRF